MTKKTSRGIVFFSSAILLFAVTGCGDQPDQDAVERGKAYSDKRLKQELDGMKDAKRGLRPIPADAFKTNPATEKPTVKP